MAGLFGRSEDPADAGPETLRVDLQMLTAAERRDLANAFLRAAWHAALVEVRILLLDLVVDVDDSVVGEFT